MSTQVEASTDSIEQLDFEPTCEKCGKHPAMLAWFAHGHGPRLRCATCTRKKRDEIEQTLEEQGVLKCIECHRFFPTFEDFIDPRML